MSDELDKAAAKREYERLTKDGKKAVAEVAAYFDAEIPFKTNKQKEEIVKVDFSGWEWGDPDDESLWVKANQNGAQVVMEQFQNTEGYVNITEKEGEPDYYEISIGPLWLKFKRSDLNDPEEDQDKDGKPYKVSYGFFKVICEEQFDG